MGEMIIGGVVNRPGLTSPLQIVWFKRDLRTRDHRPLAEAARRGPVLPLYIVEPSVMEAPDFDPSHWSFIRESLQDLRENLAQLGQPLVVRRGEVLEVLRTLAVGRKVVIHAHEETGNGITYARDRAVRRWAREAGIEFHEYPANGVVRRLRDRDQWAGIWEERMREPLAPSPKRLEAVAGEEIGEIPTGSDLGLGPDKREGAVQRGGERRAWEVLDSFLESRGEWYRGGISSPLSAETACSRLSPYLAWGNLSTRQVMVSLRRRMEWAGGRWAGSLRAFESRMHWRCHFIQKLEDEPEIEYRNFVRAYDGLRENEFNEDYFAAWREGRTGYPMIDACMRMLLATGWLNFRMRSMLVAFAAYDLWLHWDKPAKFLARQFLDYEPGIHYPQFQMQSGTAGHATIRLYNPVKQGQEQDPTGEFVRKWVPELSRVPASFLHAPWLMPREQQAGAGVLIGSDYPAPVVDHREAMVRAKARIAEFRRNPALASEVAEVFARHGSRRRSTERKPPPGDDRQMKLF